MQIIIYNVFLRNNIHFKLFPSVFYVLFSFRILSKKIYISVTVQKNIYPELCSNIHFFKSIRVKVFHTDKMFQMKEKSKTLTIQFKLNLNFGVAFHLKSSSILLSSLLCLHSKPFIATMNVLTSNKGSRIPSIPDINNNP